MSRVSISLKNARWLLLLVDDTPGLQWGPTLENAVEELRAALNPKPKPKKSLPFPSRAKAKATKKRSKRDETAEIRAAVMERAGNKCEACGWLGTEYTPLQLDHQFGRVRVRQSERNTWLLCPPCHRRKTDNSPSAAWWLEVFVQHAELRGFSEEAGMATRLLGKQQAKAELSKGVSP